MCHTRNMRYEGPRGLVGYDHFDTKWHGEVRVQRSSFAGCGPCCWVFATLSYSNEPEKNSPKLHLNLGDAISLRDALSDFIASAKGE
jgi:hypothetical protein